MSFLLNDAEYEKHLLKEIKKFPDEIIQHIFCYLAVPVIQFITRKNYIWCYKKHAVRSYLPSKQITSYIRHVIRTDSDLAFSKLIHVYWTAWRKNKNYYYKNSSYGNYLSFVKDYAVQNNSSKIRYIISNKKDKKTKRSKKSTIRTEIWNN